MGGWLTILFSQILQKKNLQKLHIYENGPVSLFIDYTFKKMYTT